MMFWKRLPLTQYLERHVSLGDPADFRFSLTELLILIGPSGTIMQVCGDHGTWIFHDNS